MISVKNLIEHLKKYPKDAMVHAYEGEAIGIVITHVPKNEGDTWDELGFIPASEHEDPKEDQPPTKPRTRTRTRKNK